MASSSLRIMGGIDGVVGIFLAHRPQLIVDTPPAAPIGIGGTLLGAAGRLMAGSIVSRALSFLVGIVAARTLTEFEFGGFGAVQSAVSMTGTIATFSLGLAATRYVARFRAEDEERAADIARLVLLAASVSILVVGLGFLIAAPWVARTVLSESSLQTPLRLGAVYMAGVVGFGVASGVLLGYERYAASAIAAVVQNAVILVSVLWLSPHMRLTGTVLAHALGFGGSFALALWFLRTDLGRFSMSRFRTSWRADLRELAHFCLPHSLSFLAIGPAGAIAVALLARSQPDGYSELGYFTAGQRYYLLILFFSGFIGSALLPVFSRLSTDVDDSRRGLDYGLIGTGMLAVPLGVGIILAAPLLMGIFGPAYTRHWTVLIPIAAWATIEAVGGVLGISLVARGRQWFVFAQGISFAVALVGLSFLLRPFGAPGLAGAYLGGIVVVGAWSFLPMRDLLKPSGRAVAAYLMSFALTAAAGIVSLLLPDGWHLVAAPAGAALAFGAYLSLLENQERAALFVTVRRQAPSSG